MLMRLMAEVVGLVGDALKVICGIMVPAVVTSMNPQISIGMPETPGPAIPPVTTSPVEKAEVM
jgi:hypothetical protein